MSCKTCLRGWLCKGDVRVWHSSAHPSTIYNIFLLQQICCFVKLIHLNDLLDDVKKDLGKNLGQTNRETDRQTYKQTDKHTNRQTNRRTGSDVELSSATKKRKFKLKVSEVFSSSNVGVPL